MADQQQGGGTGTGGFMAGVLIGGAIGVAAGLLLAPKSGDEMRTMLSERSQELRDKADELTAAARERMTSATTAGRRAARKIRGESSPLDEMDLDNENL